MPKNSLQHSAEMAVKDTERIFAEIIRSIEEKCSQVTDMFRSQVSQAQGLMKQLEQEIAEKKKRDAELQKLAKIENHVRFLQVTLLRIHSDNVPESDLKLET